MIKIKRKNMQHQKLYKWLLAVLAVGFLASCARTNYPERRPYPQDDGVYYPNGRNLPPGQAKKVYGHRSAKVFAPGQQRHRQPPYGYRPPLVIIISDHLAYTDRNGARYYDNEYGYRYWRNRDGKYYLDNQYGQYNDRRYEKKRKKNKRYHNERDDD
jgi:hypothetical protein